MNTFFSELVAMLSEGQELQLNIKKVGAVISVSVTPNIKIGGSITMSGSEEDLDNEFLAELKKVIEEKPKFTVAVKEPEEKDDEEEEGTETVQRGAGTKVKMEKKPAAKKAVAKTATKVDDKKEPEVKPEDVKAEMKPEEKEEPKSEEDAKEENKARVFKSIMDNAAKLEADRKWKEALAEYQNATSYFPEEKKALEGIERAQKWVKAMKAIDL